MTGLPIDGEPVILQKQMMYMEEAECLRLLRVKPYSVGKKRGYVKAEDLKLVVEQFSGDDATEEELVRACRAAALLGILNKSA